MRFPYFHLVDWFANAEGRFDISLSHSDCDPLRVSDLLDDRGQQDFAEFDLGYGPFEGLDDLRDVVARQYTTLDKEDVTIFNGASEAIFTFMQTTLNPGDEVVAQMPMFNTLHSHARTLDCRIVEWRPTDEMSCSFDVSSLLDLITERTKLIVFNFPHNPSGQTITRDELESIVASARRVGAYLFSDEQFRLLEMPTTPTLPAACDVYEKAVSVAGVSKTLGLGGLRVGWLAARCREVLQASKEFRFYTTEMTNTPCQYLARRALERSGSILERNRTQLWANVELLERFVNRWPDTLRLHPPKAGTMAVVEQKTPWSSIELCGRLLDEQRLFIVPGGVMGLPDRLLRIGLARKDFAEGLARLGAFLDKEVGG